MRTSKGYKLAKPYRGRRLSNFRPEFADQARKLCQLGATDIELADFFDVTPETISAWRATHKEFSEAMRIGSEAANDRVERSLYQRACGYERDAVRIINGKNGVTRVPYREHVPGDVAAQMKWLYNRMPRQWRDKVDISHEIEPEMTSAPALKHGGYSATAILPGENRAEFEELYQGLIAELRPDGPLEDDAVSQLALLLWRKQNLSIYRKAEIARQRCNVSVQPRGAYSERAPDKEEIVAAECSAAVQACEQTARRELGDAYELVAAGEIVTHSRLEEELKLEANLDLVRRELSNTAGTAAWLEGWTMPVEKAIEDVLMSEAAAPPG